jgi:hypothetical protein
VGIFIVPNQYTITTLSGNLVAKVFLNGKLVQTETIPNATLLSKYVPYASIANSEYIIKLKYPLGLSVNDILAVGWEHTGTELLSMIYNNATVDITKDWGRNSNIQSYTAGYIVNMSTPPALPSQGSFYIPFNAYRNAYSLDDKFTATDNIILNKYYNAFEDSAPQTMPSLISKVGETIAFITTPSNFNSSHILVMQHTITSVGGYWTYSLPNLINPTGVLSISAEIFNATTHDLQWLIQFCALDGSVINTANATVTNAKSMSTSARFKLENIAIPASTNYIKVGIQTYDSGAVYCMSDITVLNQSTVPDVYIKGRNDTTSLANVMLAPIAPPKVYTVVNDVASGTSANAERHYALPLYIDYMFNKKTDITFKDSKDKYYFLETISDDQLTFNNGVNVYDQIKTLNFTSNTYTVPSVNITQRSTKASITKTQKPMVLTLGDSVTAGYLTNNMPYWAYTNKLFRQEDIDFGNKGSRNSVFVGSCPISTNISYKNVSETITAYAEGRGGWCLYDYLRRANQLDRTQANWDYLGLGNGTHTDYTGSMAQKDLFANTVENNTTATPSNPFFDNDKTGNIKFSIAKWLSRYKTLDDSGNKLTLGNGTGSLITSANISSINVGTPTHIVIQLGTNDLNNRTLSVYETDLLAFITELRSQLPSAYIIISLAPPLIGLWNKDWYPNYSNIPNPVAGDWFNNASYFANYFSSYDEVTNKTFLLPTYFTTPTAEAFYDYPSTDGEVIYITSQ